MQMIRKCTISSKESYVRDDWIMYEARNTTQQFSVFVFNDDQYFNDVTVCFVYIG